MHGTKGGDCGYDWFHDAEIAVDATADQFTGSTPYIGIVPPQLASKFHHKLAIDVQGSSCLT